MVGHSKSKRRSSRRERLSTTIITEMTMLKAKNTVLAKELAETRCRLQQVLKDQGSMRGELFNSEAKNMMYVEGVKRIDDHTKSCLAKILSFSEDITRILQEVANLNQITKTLSNVYPTDASTDVSLESSKCDGKMRAVKPMISGHTIGRPTINLKRVSTEQLQRRRFLVNVQDVTQQEVETSEDPFDNLLASHSVETGAHREEQDEEESEVEDQSEDTEQDQSEENVDEEENETDENLEDRPTPSPSYNRLNTLPEVSKENVTQVNASEVGTSSKTNYDDTENSASPNKTITNPSVKLEQLSRVFLKNYPASPQITINQRKSDGNRSSTNISALDGTTIQNSVTKIMAKGRPSENIFDVSTICNISCPESAPSVDKISDLLPCNRSSTSLDLSPYDLQRTDEPVPGPSGVNTRSNRPYRCSPAKLTVMAGLGLSLVDNTSTPYTPLIGVTTRKKKSVDLNPQDTPKRPSSADTKTLKKKDENVTVRKRSSKTSKTSKLRECVVNIRKLPEAELRSSLRRPSQKSREDSRDESATSNDSPRKRRTRACVAGSMKEPSLTKKMRRSR